MKGSPVALLQQQRGDKNELVGAAPARPLLGSSAAEGGYLGGTDVLCFPPLGWL